MSSTNKTPNLELSQFLANDIPSWLGDYNGDMLKIDTAVQSANATASAASGTATTASNQAQNALNVANSAETRSTNNAEDITDLKGALTNSIYNTTLLTNNVDTHNNLVTSSDYITKISVWTFFSANPTNTTAKGDLLLLPLFSCVGNIFKLPVSTLSDDNTKIYCGVATMLTINTPNIHTVALFAYYDGANTIFYITVKNVVYSLTIQNVWTNTVVLPTGNFVPVSEIETHIRKIFN